MILHEKTNVEFGYTFENASQYKNFYCICDYCGKEFFRCKKTIKQCNQTVSKDSCGIGECKKQKSEEVQLIKFGIKNIGGSKESLEKRKKTSQEKYSSDNYASSETRKKDNIEKLGVEHHTQTQEWKDKRKENNVEKLGVEHHTQDHEYQEKLKTKCQGKYGADHFMVTPEFKEKVKKTMHDKYGDYYIATQECRDRVKETNIKNFGVPYPMQSEDVKKKVQAYFLVKYGMHYSKTEDFKHKLIESYLEHYGVEHYSKTQEFKDKISKLFNEKYGKHFLKTQIFRDKCKQTCLEKYGVDHQAKVDKIRQKMIQTCIERYGTAHPNSLCGKTQTQIGEWLNGFGFSFEENNYKILGKKEIDLYDDNLKLGIEYCGLYWHNEFSKEPRGRDAHVYKYKRCKEKDIRLITIFEDEWILRNKQCKNYLKAVLGKFERKVFARKCIVKEIDKIIANEFYDENHIIGKANSIMVSFGLYFNDELVGLISLGNHHRMADLLVLNRLCFKDNVQVPGGASRLFKQCINWAKNKEYDKIISWSDNRWSIGVVYEKLGFAFEKELAPDYSYVDLKTHFVRKSKQSQKKKVTKCPEEMTEKEWCLSRGLARIWDCGKKRWIYKIPQVLS